jgi:sialate O-acetylesterase
VNFANFRVLLASSALFSAAAIAAPSIDPQFGPHAVIQRNWPIHLSGSATPGEKLTVSFGGQTVAATADKAGRWQAGFSPRADGKNLELSVTGPDGTAASTDLEIGDVWLCSGQSNMEYPIPFALGYGGGRADPDPDLRLTKVPQQLAGTPQVSFSKGFDWQPASPDVKNFSAACYFMVKHLRETAKVPIGAIDDSWGGTPIRAWMDLDANAASGGAEDAALVRLNQKNPAAAVRAFADRWGSWWRSKTGDRTGHEPWHDSSSLTWTPVPSLERWDNWGPEWKNWVGSAWFRERVTLTAAQAAQPATLHLSAADDMDQTFVNGVSIGGLRDPFSPRSYPVPKGLLKPGVNEIMVFVRNVWGQGGFTGPASDFALSFGSGQSLPLSGGWEYSRIADSVGDPPVTPWEGSAGVSTIYNAMVAPLGSLGVTGVAWYQGENDTGLEPGYDKRLAAFMGNWRQQFGKPDLPFLIVGLAGYGTPVAHPKESNFAEVVNDQRVATTADPHAALVSAIDIGAWRDIHPSDKQEVGRRLALAADALVYHTSDGRVGPLPASAVRSPNGVTVTFTKPLQALSGNRPIGFELCGATPDSCRFTDATVNGNTVTLAGDGQPVTRVRYAWADFPIVNLYDMDLLPAPVFELPVQ